MERKENGREETEFQRQMPDLNGSNETNLMTQLIDHNCISESEENSIKLRGFVPTSAHLYSPSKFTLVGFKSTTFT